MWDYKFEKYADVKLKEPICIISLPDYSRVGRLVADYIISSSAAQLVAKLFSPYFPDIIMIDDRGICTLPHYAIYASNSHTPNLIVITGDIQPPFENSKAHYILSRVLMRYIAENNCKGVISVGSLIKADTQTVYVASNRDYLINVLLDKGCLSYRGKIIGTGGLVFGMACLRKISSLCLLGATVSEQTDRGAAYNLFRILNFSLALLSTS